MLARHMEGRLYFRRVIQVMKAEEPARLARRL
jgi:hypothetical protein